MTHSEILEQHFGFKPYPYQERVAKALLGGKNVICRSPTGSGKTEAALAPFIIARETNHATFPLKAMFASPMKTLAKSIHARAQKVTTRLGLDVRLHTGEDQGAPVLEGDIVVTTIDQLMSNYAHIPLSMSNGRANIGAGAVISSYIVFDEFHLLDPKRAFRTALLMIEQLKGIAPFLLMTATLSSKMIAELEKVCDAVVIEPSTEELKAMPSQQKTRNFKRISEEISAKAVAKAHQNRSLVLLNTVDRAQAMAETLLKIKNSTEDEKRNNTELAAQAENLKNTRIELIHSRFMPSDRALKEARLEGDEKAQKKIDPDATLSDWKAQNWMGEKSTENIILISTQVVEVGINISSENLHAELCPANSLLQRAGRCARFAGETGTVYVYDLPLDTEGKKRILPYKELEVELESTWKELMTLENPVGFTGEAALINAVHESRDLGYLKEAIASRINHLEKLHKAQGGDRAMASSLIREVISQSVILHPEPEKMFSWYEVGKCEMVSLFPGKLNAVLTNQTDEWGDTGGWAVMIPTETQTDTGTRLTWRVCNDPKLLQLSPLIAVNPARVFYSPEFGLRPDILKPSEGNFPRRKKAVDIGEREDWWYTFETYREHIENVMNALEKQVPEVLATCKKIDSRFLLPQGTLLHAIKVAIAAHDIGKLSTGWQNWTRAWQIEQLEQYPDLLWNGVEGKRKVVPQTKNVFCAHTDYHPKLDKTRSSSKPKRPGHSGESASVLEKTYYEKFLERIGDDDLGSQVFCGIYGAIAKHHGARSEGKTEAWKLDGGSSTELQAVFLDLAKDTLEPEVLRKLEQQGIQAAQPIDFMPNPPELLAWLTYSLVSRALRQSDSNSFVRHEVQEEANEN